MTSLKVRIKGYSGSKKTRHSSAAGKIAAIALNASMPPANYRRALAEPTTSSLSPGGYDRRADRSKKLVQLNRLERALTVALEALATCRLEISLQILIPLF
ncbi:hypothetical protein GFL09_10830 [Pseudomonas stutzeri]|uniref:hypothetical protein n=1 Tax=Stutzerimonas stutzeri TaxID=316 RepID=UPI001260187E|nr:hypothetical protein [Stutzerimonas stutzeri]MBK3868180.1 hypothetical protein [Stutzerimonas stutzeri]